MPKFSLHIWVTYDNEVTEYHSFTEEADLVDFMVNNKNIKEWGYVKSD